METPASGGAKKEVGQRQFYGNGSSGASRPVENRLILRANSEDANARANTVEAPPAARRTTRHAAKKAQVVQADSLDLHVRIYD